MQPEVEPAEKARLREGRGVSYRVRGRDGPAGARSILPLLPPSLCSCLLLLCCYLLLPLCSAAAAMPACPLSLSSPCPRALRVFGIRHGLR